MKSANLESLKEKIVRPDIDKHLVPLMLYRGSNNMEFFGRMHRIWNFAITCMESEAESYGDAIKIAASPDFAHLCGPRRPLAYGNFASAFGRMLDNPRVTDNIDGLTKYVRTIKGPKWKLTPVDLYTNDNRHRQGENVAPWRIIGYSPEEQARRDAIGHVRRELSAERKLAREIERKKIARDSAFNRENSKAKAFYPYIIHKPKDGNAEYEMMVAVNKAVPAHLPDWLRADICQDLICAVLAGEITVDALAEGAKAFTKKLFAMHPIKYGPLSLDAPMGADDDRTLLDIVSGSPIEVY